MARKPTKAELAKARYDSFFAGHDNDDSDYLDFSRRQEESTRPAPVRTSKRELEQAEPTTPRRLGLAERSQLAAYGRGADIVGDQIYALRNAEEREAARLAQEEAANAERGAIGRFLNTDFISPLASKLAGAIGANETLQRVGQTADTVSELNRRLVEEETQKRVQESPVIGRGERVLTDLAGSPDSLLSVFGGPTAAVPLATIGADKYREAREAGVAPQEAAQYARTQALGSSAIAAVPTGRIWGLAARALRGSRPVTTAIRGNAAEITRRGLQIGAAESVEEMTQTVTEDRINAAYGAIAGDEKLKEFAKTQVSQDLWSDTLRAGAAGFVGGKALGSPIAALEVARDNGRLAAEATREFDQAEINFNRLRKATEAQQAAATARPAPTESQEDIPLRYRDLTANGSAGTGSVVGEPTIKGQKKKSVDREAAAEAARLARQARVEQFAGTDTAAVIQQGPSSARKLLQSVVAERGQADSKRVLSLLRDRRLDIVSNPKDLGMDPETLGNVPGIEKDGRIYLFADNLPKTKGAASAAAAAVVFHEAKHVGDFAADQNLPSNLAGFVGMENAEPVNRKIEAAAQRGNVLAQQAVADAEANANTGGNYEEELMPSFISRLKEDRNKASGVANIVSDIRNGVKSRYNKLFGDGDDVQLEDVFKLSEQLVDYMAQNKSYAYQPKSQAAARRMFISGGTGASKALSEGRSYLSVDGKRKYEISDLESRPAVPDDVEIDRIYRAEEVFSHPKLYEELPQLKDVPIVFVNNTEGEEARYGGAYIKPDEQFPLGMIEINLGNKGPTEFNDFDSFTHRNLVHEMQHAAQNTAGSTGGSNPNSFRTPEMRKRVQQATDTRQAIAFAKAMGDTDTAGMENDLADLQARIEEDNAVNEETYQKVLGEQEAFGSVGRMALTDAERAEDTTDLGRSIETQFLARDGEILSERGKRLAADTPVRRSVQAGEIRQDVPSAAMRKVRKVVALFDSNGELGKALAKLAEEATGEASYYADLAQTAALKIDRAIKTEAASLVSSGQAASLTEGMAKIRDRAKKTITSLQSIPEEGRRQATLAGLVRQYPELLAIQDGYNLVNELSRKIVQNELKAADGPMTDAELKRVETIMDNGTKYLTRVYAAFEGPTGRSWSEKLFNEYQAVKAELAKGNSIPENKRDSYERYDAALNYIIANNVAVFDYDELSRMSMDRVRMVYDTWFQNRDGFEAEVKRNAGLKESEQPAAVKNALVEAIVEKGRQVNGRQVQNRAHSIVNGLLGLSDTNNPVVTYYRGFKEDRSILMERQNVPEEIRALFGEIEDPAMRIMMTIAKQGELVARTNMLLDIRETMYGDQLIDNEDKANDTNNRFSQQLTGDSWGPLKEHWVTPEVYSVIRDDREMAVNMEDAIGRLVMDSSAVNQVAGQRLLRTYARLAGFQKLAAIVWNPVQMIWNFGGSWIMGLANGNVNVASYRKAAASAARLFTKELQATGADYFRIIENDANVSDLIRYDIIDSAMVQEIRKLPHQHIREMLSNNGRITKGLVKTLGVSGAAIRQAFALSDLTVKIANYYQRVDALKAYYAAEGREISDEAIKKEAADTIKDTNITFRRAAPIVKMTERAGLTYVLPYIQGTFRSAIYNYVTGVKDITRGLSSTSSGGKALMLRQGVQRLAGVSSALFVVQAMAQSFLTGDEEKDEKIRQLQMLDARYADSVYVGDDKNGNPLMLRWSRFDPLGPVTDIMRILNSGATDEQKRRDVGTHLHELIIKPRLGQEMIRLAFEFTTENYEAKTKETKLERLFPRATSLTKEFLATAPAVDYADAEAFIGVLDTMLPGATNIIDPNNVKPVEYKGEKADQLTAQLLTATGGRLDAINPQQAAAGAWATLKAERQMARQRVFEGLSNITDPTDRDAIIEVMDVLEGERKAFVRLKEVYEGMEALGYSKSKIEGILKDKVKVSEHDRHLLHSGKYDTSVEGWRTKGSAVLSKQSINERQANRENRATDPTKAEAQRQALRKAVKALQAAGYKLKE